MDPKKSLKERFLDGAAFLISSFFSPYLVSVVFILIISFIYALGLKQFLPWILISLFFIAAIPVGYIIWFMEKKKISDIHLSNLKERKIPFIIGAVSSVIGASILFCLKAATPILAVVTAYAVNAILISIITLYWKISIHSAFLVATVSIVMIVFGTKFWPLFLLWIPVAWARVHRRRHTPEQVLAGATLAIISTSIVFYIFGYGIGG